MPKHKFNNNIILAHRHPEYLMAPMSILAVFGLGCIFSDPEHKALLSKLRDNVIIKTKFKGKNINITQKTRLLHLFIVIILILSLAGTTYSAHKSLNASVEDISAQDIAIFNWIDEADQDLTEFYKNTTMIASDHRIARMMEAYGFNTTKDETKDLWESENLDEYIHELIGVGKNHSRVTHIIIDDFMKNEVVHVHLGLSKYMTNETWDGGYKKFQNQPFEKIQRNETLEFDLAKNEPVRWAEVYSVNWTYIEKNYLIK